VTPKNIKEYISDDNDRLDGIFRVFRDFRRGNAKTGKDLLHALMAGINRHIQWEEKILFPLLENRMGLSDRGPTPSMREEHRELEAVLNGLHDEVLGNRSASGDIERELVDLLARHHRKGDDHFYPMLDHSLSDDEKMAAYHQMKSIPLEKINRCCGQSGQDRTEERP